MSNKRKSFLLHIDSLDILDDLTDSESGELFKAIKDYHCGVTPELSGLVRIAFSPFRNQFARDAEKYSLTCERRAEAGSIGGRANKRDPGVDNKGETQLYVLRLYNENEDFIKIGTTTNRINRRFSGVKNMPYEYEIIHQLIGEDVELESLLQSALSEFLYDPSIRFPGHNECFTRECLNKLKQIQPFAQAKCSKIGQKIANLADSDSKNDSDSKSDSKSDNDNNKTPLVQPKVKQKKVSYSDYHLAFAKWMHSLILNINPNAKEPNFESWANTIRLMTDIDKRNGDEMVKVFQWANQDSFWNSNILSADKFRKQYDQLSVKSRQEDIAIKVANNERTQDEVDQFTAELNDQFERSQASKQRREARSMKL